MTRWPTALGLMALAGCSRTAGRRADEPPLLRLVAHDFGYTADLTVPAGLTRIRLVNQGGDIHEAVITRMVADSGNADRFVAAWRRGVSWPSFSEDVGGARLTAAGDSSEVWIILEPGRYVLICTKGDHLDRGMAADLTVTPVSTPIERPRPEATVELELLDYAFRFPARIPAGRHLVHVVNRAKEPHEMDIYRLTPGRGLPDLVAWFDGGEKGAPPLEIVGGGGDFTPGHEEWLPMTLARGRYLIVCGITQGTRDDGAPHYRLGMTFEFEVE